jgi:hypothetical protein
MHGPKYKAICRGLCIISPACSRTKNT